MSTINATLSAAGQVSAVRSLGDGECCKWSVTAPANVCVLVERGRTLAGFDLVRKVYGNATAMIDGPGFVRIRAEAVPAGSASVSIEDAQAAKPKILQSAGTIADVSTANAVAAAGATPTKAEFDAVVALANATKAALNTLQAAMRAANLAG